MNEVKMVVRKKPRIVEPKRKSWSNVVDRLSTPSITKSILLMFSPWNETLNPNKNAECALTNFAGFPIYKYKELNNRTFYLRPRESPGFPGS